jgi:hypothetical protein
VVHSLGLKSKTSTSPATPQKNPVTHDRFLIIDQKELYHLGASLKDLGKKWFAFSKMDAFTETILNQLNAKA